MNKPKPLEFDWMTVTPLFDKTFSCQYLVEFKVHGKIGEALDDKEVMKLMDWLHGWRLWVSSKK